VKFSRLEWKKYVFADSALSCRPPLEEITAFHQTPSNWIIKEKLGSKSLQKLWLQFCTEQCSLNLDNLHWKLTS